MSSIELSDATLYKEGSRIENLYKKLNIIDKLLQIALDVAEQLPDEKKAKARAYAISQAEKKTRELFHGLDANTITYLFRLTVLSNGNKLSRLSIMVLNCSQNDKIGTFRFILDKEYLPYYRFFAKLGDYNTVATIFDKRGIDDSLLLDFREFFKTLDINSKNELINNLPDCNFESIFILAHDA